MATYNGHRAFGVVVTLVDNETNEMTVQKILHFLFENFCVETDDPAAYCAGTSTSENVSTSLEQLTIDKVESFVSPSVVCTAMYANTLVCAVV